MPQILIADDSMFQRFVLTKLVKDMGCEPLEASNGQECLDIGLAADPDLIVLDLNMPVRSGLEVLEELRKAGRKAPTLVVTADIQSTTRQRCEELGAARLLNKPVEEADFREAVLQLLGTR
ncbi:response regulator [Fundidesulfovibrio soli]|uniref:response regulator n=1 Tax=Fundidesulfovibrio soli TaxID=2922716 RepID=UPI001FAFEF45|nr:response regulator [Fundidesulfovibrio soli]